MSKQKPKKRSKYVYLCGVDWQHELGEEMLKPDVVVYPSVESLKKHRTCWKSCGIVKLKVTLEEWVEDQDLFRKEKD
jgi:hypothetical protein